MEIYVDNLISNLHTCTGKIKKFVLTVKIRVVTNIKKTNTKCQQLCVRKCCHSLVLN